MARSTSRNLPIVIASIMLMLPLAFIIARWGFPYVLFGLTHSWIAELCLGLGVVILVATLVWRMMIAVQLSQFALLLLNISAVVIGGIGEFALFLGLVGCC
jgi:hypothetical protein